jgi:hypothetical protein
LAEARKRPEAPILSQMDDNIEKWEISMSKKSTLDPAKAEKVAKVEVDLDEALDESFPASDPPSMSQPRSGTDATQRRLTKRPERVKK